MWYRRAHFALAVTGPAASLLVHCTEFGADGEPSTDASTTATTTSAGRAVLAIMRELTPSMLELMDRETLDAEELKALYEGRELAAKERIIIPTYAEKERQAKEKRKAASIFGATPPKPATS